MAHPHAGGAAREAALGWLTISDTRTSENDRSAEVARRSVERAGHRIALYRIAPDEPDQVKRIVEEWLAGDECEAILTSGGTGVSARDRTFEALSGLLVRRLDGFGELFRMLSYEQVGSAAMLSRAIGGIAGSKPLFALPGSPKAVELALDKIILPELPHLLDELQK